MQCTAPEGATAGRPEGAEAMTEVEFSRLMSDLSTRAKTLNNESDSVNSLIDRFEEKLREINLGIEVWLERELESEEWSDFDDVGEQEAERGTHDCQLGFVKWEEGRNHVWRLGVRRATYRENRTGGYDFVEVVWIRRLAETSRDLRIRALSFFPDLVKRMTEIADSQIATIEAAKKFVK